MLLVQLFFFMGSLVDGHNKKKNLILMVKIGGGLNVRDWHPKWRCPNSLRAPVKLLSGLLFGVFPSFKSPPPVRMGGDQGGKRLGYISGVIWTDWSQGQERLWECECGTPVIPYDGLCGSLTFYEVSLSGRWSVPLTDADIISYPGGLSPTLAA